VVNIVYNVACSLDGFIATEDGGVEWLEPFQDGSEDYGFGEFYSSLDALLMGSRTYEFALAHPPWMSPDKPSWVFTRRDLPLAHPSVTLTSGEPGRVVESLRASNVHNAWLMGGGELAASFRAGGLINQYMIAVVPVLLGTGIRLFADGGHPEHVDLTEVNPFTNGVVQLIYERPGSG
jgi:dihydrofolate reductase